jgi:hypothetical protein
MGCGAVTISGPPGMQGLARPEGVDPGRANREAMPDLTAKRTLVKSPPELWSELSEVERLARHLGAFGEIKITKLEPEHTVAWEGEGASGTVSIEPSGWGTKVTLTAQLPEAEAPLVNEEPPVDETVEKAVLGDLTLEEPTEPETAAEEEVEDLATESEVEESAAEEPVVEESVMPEAVAEEREVDEPEVEEPPPALEPPTREPVGPVGKPRRKRGFLAWLFRQRSSSQAAAPAFPAPSEPVVEAPAVEEPAVVETPISEHPGIAEDLPAEHPAVDEPFGDEPVADEPVADEPVAEAETPPIAEEPALLGSAPTEAATAEPTEEATADRTEEAAAAPSEEVAQDPHLDLERAQAILDGALDALGSAHHRPFSRG